MFKTIAGLAIGAFILKRTSPETYAKAVTAINDVIDSASDITTAVRGQVKSYTAEACKDAAQRLQAVDPQTIENLRALLDGQQQTQQPAQQHRPAPRRRP